MHEYKLNEKATLYWLGHAGFKIKTGEKTIYIDPFEAEKAEPADIVLITHPHYDHCSISDLKRIVGQNTVIVAPPDCTSKLAGNIGGRLVLSEPSKKFNIKGVEIEAAPAYNINKLFHPKQNGWVGYIVNASGTRIYHAGDTDLIPEMSNIKADVALLPVGGNMTMSAKEAAKACDALKPKVAIPMHYGKITKTGLEVAQEFKNSAQCKTEII